MKKLTYTIRFHSPAFLGNAEQSGQWRTPPFKALLRQWWRVAYAIEKGFVVDVAGMRVAEGLMFGVAADTEGSSRNSQVRLRLSHWNPGGMKVLPAPDLTVQHPEVNRPVGSQLYLGYGPLKSQRGTALKNTPAIQTGESALFNLAFPSATSDSLQLELALSLMNLYGTVGGRSRNGWGSFALEGGDHASKQALGISPSLRDWEQAIKLDWPHAIGHDAKGALIWQTAPQANWQSVMRKLAEVKIGLRTQSQFKFPHAPGRHASPLQRHWLSYPVTHHPVQSWGNNLRLPNSLRFKVRQLPDKKLVGVIFHMPCKPPEAFNPNAATLLQVWQKVHTFLDAPAQALKRIPA